MLEKDEPMNCPEELKGQFKGKRMILPNGKVATVGMALIDNFSYNATHDRTNPIDYTAFRMYVGDMP